MIYWNTGSDNNSHKDTSFTVTYKWTKQTHVTREHINNEVTNTIYTNKQHEQNLTQRENMGELQPHQAPASCYVLGRNIQSVGAYGNN